MRTEEETARRAQIAARGLGLAEITGEDLARAARAAVVERKSFGPLLVASCAHAAAALEAGADEPDAPPLEAIAACARFLRTVPPKWEAERVRKEGF